MDQRYQAFTLADRQVYQHPFYAVPTLYRLAPGVDWDNSSWEIEVTTTTMNGEETCFFIREAEEVVRNPVRDYQHH